MIKFKNQPNRMMERSPFLFNELFDDMFGNMLAVNKPHFTSPAVNITESDEQFKIEVAAPGLKKEDFKISVDDGMLTISAEKKEERRKK
jgi:HSP20 family protein